MALACWAPGLIAQTAPATNATIRVLSREECIRLTLEHELSIRIARHNPIIAQLTLKGSYGYYEPTLNVGGEHRYNKDDTSIDASSTSDYRSRSLDYDGTLRGDITGTRTSTSSDESWQRTQTDSLLAAGTGLTGRSPIGTIWNIGGGISDGDRESSRTFSESGLDIWRQTSPYVSAGTNLNLNRINGSSDFSIHNNSVGLSVVQPLLRDFWTDAGRTQIQLNKKSLKMSGYDLEWQIMNVVAQVQKAYYDLIATRDAVKVAEKALELAQQLLAETQKKVQVGVATPLDEKQVESQAATTTANLIEARRLQSVAENQLKTFLTDDYGQWYNVAPVPSEQLIAVPESYELNESWLRGIALRPDYNRRKTDVERQGLVVRLQRNQVYPQLDFRGFVGQSVIDNEDQRVSSSFLDNSDDTLLQRNIRTSTDYNTTRTRTTSPEYAVGLVLSVPIGGNVSARNQLKIAKETQKQMQESFQFEHMKLLVQIEDALKMVKAKHEQVGAFREARVFAKAAYDAEVKKYENGKSTSFFVLDFQNRLTRAAADEIRALADYNKALVDFYLVEGSTLERNQITVDYR
jgi:outer membrane protein TolC